MGSARVWVHRRHEDYPSVGVGLLTIDEGLADALIKAGCAQPWHTDQRKLIPYDPSQPAMQSANKPKRGRPRKQPTETTPPSQDLEIEPSQADVEEAAKAKYPRYKRRDIRAEK